MRIRVKTGSTNIGLWIPTGLFLNRGTIWLADTVGRHYAGDAMEGIPPEAMSAMVKELQRVKKKYGSWTLVEVKTSDGGDIAITL